MEVRNFRIRNTFWALLICSVFVCAPRAAAQPVGAGVKLGTTFTPALTISNWPLPENSSLFFNNQTPFIVGPYVEFRLPFQFAIEADALYNSAPIASNIGGAGGSTWQFPVLAKYKLLKGPVRPYLGGGASFSRISSYSNAPSDLLHQSNYGVVLEAGVEIKLLFLRITPEIRYNYWALTDISGPNVPPAAVNLLLTGPFHSERNQVSLLVGFGF
jgi:hypothetical protein